MKHVLVAEDESAIREFIVINLMRSGYKVTQAENGLQALELYKNTDEEIDIAILDIMMPEMDGLTVCKEIRSLNENVGIIMLTAKTQEMDKITGLMMGADDYVTKPFSPSELMARVDAIYRRVSVNTRSAEKVSESEYLLRSGEFVLNLRNRTLTKSGKLIELTQVEFQIMEYFLSNQGAALDRNDILAHVWGDHYFGEDKVVDVNIRRLRIKIEDDPTNPAYITTVWGYGYKWGF